MTRRREGLLWGLSVLIGAGCISILKTPVRAGEPVRQTPVTIEGFHDPAPVDPQVVIDANPFRLTRRPSNVAFGEMAAVRTNPPVYREPLPTLTLRGVVGGKKLEALLEGIPGRDAPTMVKANDQFGELRIRAITTESVLVQFRDSSWRVAMVRAWR